MAVVPFWTLPELHKTRQRPGREHTRGNADCVGLAAWSSVTRYENRGRSICCEFRPSAGISFRARKVPGMKNSGSRRTAALSELLFWATFLGRYFSGVTAAGVRSNIFDTTLLLPPRLAKSPEISGLLRRAVPAREGPGSFRTRPRRRGRWPGWPPRPKGPGPRRAWSPERRAGPGDPRSSAAPPNPGWR